MTFFFWVPAHVIINEKEDREKGMRNVCVYNFQFFMDRKFGQGTEL